MDYTEYLDPFIFYDMGLIRDIYARSVDQGVRMDLAVERINTVVSVLETDALLARATGKNQIFGVKLTVAYAVKRARDLREMVAH